MAKISIESLQELHSRLKARKYPTHYLTTHETMEVIREKLARVEESPESFWGMYGIPIESFATIGEMFARKQQLEFQGHGPKCLTIDDATRMFVPGESPLDIPR